MKKRILTGDRPTGRLHLGHLVGSLLNRVKLQDDYETIIVIADLHVLTIRPSASDIREMAGNVRGLVLDYVASGIDPQKTTIYLQSAIPQVYELNTLFQNLVTVSRLSRVPSIKDMARDAHIDDQSLPYGLLGYPVLQAADILLSKAHLVPVGRDNVAHVEVSRDIARRFDTLYGEVFPEPEALVSNVPTLVGTDGQGKMSKSRGNTIMLSDDEVTVTQKVMGMYTDPTRVRADTPGTVEGNPVFIYHDVFNSDRTEVENLQRRYRTGRMGDVEVKIRLAAALNRYLTPIRARMAIAEERPGLIETILGEGIERMRAIAQETIRDVHKAMGLGATLRPVRTVVDAGPVGSKRGGGRDE
jgi:tryptophanyl-tRNA synthetase